MFFIASVLKLIIVEKKEQFLFHKHLLPKLKILSRVIRPSQHASCNTNQYQISQTIKKSRKTIIIRIRVKLFCSETLVKMRSQKILLVSGQWSLNTNVSNMYAFIKNKQGKLLSGHRCIMVGSLQQSTFLGLHSSIKTD